IRARYPEYFPRVQQFIQDDPILPLRQRIDRVIGLLKPASPEAIDYLARIMGSTKPRLLFISHGWGGGVGEHIDVLKRSEHYHVICLKGQGNGGVTLSLSPAGLASVSIDSAGFDEQNREQWQYLLDALQVSRIHVHHLHGWPKQIVNCLLQLAVPIDITVHDYYLLSPNYHQTADGPRCDEASWPQSDADWQQVMEPLVRAAQRVIVPSAQLASEVKAVYPFAAVLEKAHPERVMQHPAI